jgi:hypothetical protein
MQENEDLMVSGNPPRHSKGTDEPVTIDLEAQEFAAASDTERGTDSSAGDPETTSAAEAETPGEAKDEPLNETESDRAAEPREAVAPQDPAGAPQPEPPRQRPGSASGLIAAGIFGGLVALLGAGSIQYAGYLPSSPAPQSVSNDITSLSADIEGLKQSVANLAATPSNPDDGAIEKRITALETAAKTPTAAAPADSATIEAMNQKIAELTGQIDQLRSAVSQASEQQATNGADIGKRLDEAEKKLDEPRRDVAVAQAIAAAGLKAAIDRGGPFLAELDTFAGVSPDDPAVADLRNFAETGVPSRAELIRQVPDVATAIVNAVNQPDPNQSWSDRLMASATSLVSVRPVGNIEGKSVQAIAARIEDKVKNGDLPGASAEWNDLPTEGKQASAAFKQSLEARIRVEDLVGGALSKAVSGTGKEG